MKLKFTYKGGSGSGDFGHMGRPGKVGGSGPGGSGGRTRAENRTMLEDMARESAARHDTSYDGQVRIFNQVAERISERYNFTVKSSVNGGKQKRYMTTAPRNEVLDAFREAGFDAVDDITYISQTGLTAKIHKPRSGATYYGIGNPYYIDFEFSKDAFDTE